MEKATSNFSIAIGIAYQAALVIGILYWLWQFHLMGWSGSIPNTVFYLPIIGALLTLSAETDLLKSIEAGEIVDIKARALNFIHWFLLLFMMVGRWMAGGFTIGFFWLTVIQLGVLGCQVGIGISRSWLPSTQERIVGLLMMIGATMLGLLAGATRYVDPTQFGWGWLLETITAIVATAIVAWWMYQDISTIKMRAAGYPRSRFLKDLGSIALVNIVMINLLATYPGTWSITFWANAGFLFNVIVGTGMYLVYYVMWEYYVAIQKKT